MLPKIDGIGPDLPDGWQKPSRGTVSAYLTYLKEGLAPPSARHLYEVAVTYTGKKIGIVRKGLALLDSYVHPDSRSPITAVGMGYTQLALASELNIRAIVINRGIPDLAPDSRQDHIETFVNLTIAPLKSEGWLPRAELCFSMPGIGVVIPRWKAVNVLLATRLPFRLAGVDAWNVQHQMDHINGIMGAHHALKNSLSLYHVPVEWSQAFVEAEDHTMWPKYPFEQWQAMVSGEFDLASYEPYL